MSINAILEEASDASDSPNHPGASISRHRSFPLGTLMVCFTTWLIVTEVLVFDEIKFSANAELVEQATRALRGPQLIVPSERAPQLSDRAKMEKL
jgi:hypothetical protein